MDKDIITPVTIIGIGIIALLLLRKRNANQVSSVIPASPSGTEFIQNPTEAAYSPNLAPQSLSGGTINVNVANQGLQYLSNKYIPLFGFVGMAQGATYH